MAKFIKYPRGVVAEKDESVEVQITVITIPGQPIWKFSVDGAANQRESRVGIVLVSPKVITIEKSLRMRFSITNNEVEYVALLTRVATVRKLGGKAIEIFSNSRLVIGLMVSWQSEIQGCKGISMKFDNCNLVLNPSPFGRFQGGKILMQIL